MNLTEIGLTPVGNTVGLDSNTKVNESSNDNGFTQMFNQSIKGLEDKQISTQEMVKNLLTTGEGDASQTLIAVNSATSQIKMGAVMRDKLIENYQTIMNIQI